MELCLARFLYDRSGREAYKKLARESLTKQPAHRLGVGLSSAGLHHSTDKEALQLLLPRLESSDLLGVRSKDIINQTGERCLVAHLA